MRTVAGLVVVSGMCAPGLASEPIKQMALVCSDVHKNISPLKNSDGTVKVVRGEFVINQEQFKEAQDQFQKETEEIKLWWAEHKDEIETRAKAAEDARQKEIAKITKEQMNKARAQYDLTTQKWYEEHRKEIDSNSAWRFARALGGYGVYVGGMVLGVHALAEIGTIATLHNGLAITVTTVIATFTYLVSSAYENFVPQCPEITPPPFQQPRISVPAEEGVPARKRPDSSEPRFQIFSVFAKINLACPGESVLKAQDFADGQLYPVRFIQKD